LLFKKAILVSLIQTQETISKLTLEKIKKKKNKKSNLNNQSNLNKKTNNTIYIGLKNEELNKIVNFNKNPKSFYFKKKSKDKLTIYDKSTNN
jgi:PP-loop superfamily ATP-utilizing enzyme